MTEALATGAVTISVLPDAGAEESAALSPSSRSASPSSTRRRRRQGIPSRVIGGSRSGGAAARDRNDVNDSNSDGESQHGGKSKKMYNRSCPIGQFFLNPCLFVSLRLKACFLAGRVVHRLGDRRSVRQRSRGGGKGGQGESGAMDLDDPGSRVAVAIAASLALVLLLRYALSGGDGVGARDGFRHRRRPGDFPPVIILSLDFSKSGDIGGWLTPYSFPSLGPMVVERALGDDDDEEEEEEEEEKKKKEDSESSTIEHVRDDDDNYDNFGEPFYGGLEMVSLQGATGESFRRVIDMDAEERYATNLNRKGKSPHVSHHYAYDDDYVLDPECRRNIWWRLYQPNCNAFHEIDLPRKFDDDVIMVTEEQAMESHYISHGYYRDVWLVENHSHESTEKEAMALKMLRWKHKFNYKQIETVRKDAVVMERMTSSPRIIDIYGHCAFSVTAEALDQEVEEFVVPGSGYATKDELDDSKDVDVKNNFTVTEKVDMALAMAESIADLHGFKDGIIVHDDIQLCQWLRTKEGTLKLGDFNRAEVMFWDEENEEYCKYNNGPGFGNYRAPEEFDAEDLNEQIDVFSMGNNIYGLLTGLWVFYENEDDEVVQNKIIAGETAFIDERYRTRSYAEGRLVQIMERCWKKDPDKRATIFEVVSFLRETLAEHKRREEKQK